MYISYMIHGDLIDAFSERSKNKNNDDVAAVEQLRSLASGLLNIVVVNLGIAQMRIFQNEDFVLKVVFWGTFSHWPKTFVFY